MPVSSELLDALQRLSDACESTEWISLIEGRDIESGSSFIQVNGGRGPISDIEITLTPGLDSEFELDRVGHEIYTQHLDLIAAARTNLPAMISEIRRLQDEVQSLKSRIQ